MKEPQISWYIIENESVNLIDGEHYAGAYSPSNIEATFEIQVWNNKWGRDDIPDVENPILVLMFDTIEDRTLLQYCKVRIDNGPFKELEVLEDRATLPLYRPLSGKSNKGTSSDANNYAQITIKFGPISYGMKNGLKSLLVDLQFNK